jgi:hypothetical protein
MKLNLWTMQPLAQTRRPVMQTISAVWCAAGAASLSVTRRCALLGLGATTVGDDVALALHGHPRVHRGREFIELRQRVLKGVSP